MAQVHRRAGTGNGGEALDVYEYAYLAGGEQRVLESAIIALVERGTLSLRAGRLRTVDAEQPPHPVERAVIAACPRSKRVEEVFEDLRHREEIDALVHRLVHLGLVRDWRRRPTRAGRRQLAAAVSQGTLPAYVLEGAAALAPGPVRAGLSGPHTLPDGLGRTLRRMGKALEDDSDTTSGGYGGGGDGGGGGGD
ncbi:MULTISPECIES: TIGR04222 domain-containing membrane protein [Streptomyces]|uniref:TIGR04222 domain-containing membrane protein n=1 Tax=Streptomyces TaxID=1883 RepID=UPI00136A8971|nr:TIGR04222 domain-containing membrane protein [Streptomyces sp. SID1046]MYV75423.1 TIGR04222 domain-containing membrane protein [Streptomyces sp. SID1046]